MSGERLDKIAALRLRVLLALRRELCALEDVFDWHRERLDEDGLDEATRAGRARAYCASAQELAVARDLVTVAASAFEEDPRRWIRPRDDDPRAPGEIL